MNAQRFLAWLLIAVQAAALAVQSETLLFPAAIAVAGLAGAVSTRRIRLTSEQALRAAGVAALIFYAKYLIAPHAVPIDRLFIRTQLALVIGEYLLVMQVAQLFLLRTVPERARRGDAAGGRGLSFVQVSGCGEERLSAVLPGLGVVAMVCFGAVRVSNDERLMYQVLVVSFVALAALYFRASRRMVGAGRRRWRVGRAAASAAAVVGVAAAGWAASETVFRHHASIERMISAWLWPGRRQAGFSLDGGLGSVSRHRDTDSDRVALVVVADQPPGYLRGQAFYEFRRMWWRSFYMAIPDIVRPIAAPAPIAKRAGGKRVFPVRSGESDSWEIQEVWPAASLHERVFHPLGAAYLAADAESVHVYGEAYITAQDLLPGDPYISFQAQTQPDGRFAFDHHFPSGALAPPTGWPGSDPAEAGPLLSQIAGEIFEGCQTTGDRIAAVEQYFRTNYRYSRNAIIPPDEDPLTWFLRDRPPAYCEYFATAAALLLRQAGVPTRYVTGFLVTERHRYGDYWVARNRHAHAWVEAWDDEHGWVIVEATPSEGVPEPAPPAAAVQFWEYVQNGLRQFRARVAREGWGALVAAVAAFAASVPGIVLLIGMAAWIAFRVRRRHRRRPAGRTASPSYRRLHRLLDRMDRKLRRLGWERAPGETLHQFAARLADDSGGDGERDAPRLRSDGEREAPGLRGGLDMAQAADWYLRYAAMRYGGRPP